MDEDVKTSGSMTDTEIAGHVTAESTPAVIHVESDDEEEDEECTIIRPIATECRLSIETLFLFRSSSSDYLSAIDLLGDLLCAQTVIRQSAITDLFFVTTGKIVL